MKSLLRLAAAVLLIGAGAHMPSGAQQLYRWVDENGRVQYSDRPPPPGTQSQAKPVRKPGAASPAVPGEAQGPKTYAEQEAEFRKRQVERAEREAKERQEQQAAADRKRQCEEARRNLAALRGGERLVRYNAQGEREYLDDKAREEEIARTQRAVTNLCK